jgi:hypothetical protein
VATQKRITMTAAMLSSVKSMKMLGLAETMNEKITELRENEIKMANKLRWLMVAYNASGKSFSRKTKNILILNSQRSWDIFSSHYLGRICYIMGVQGVWKIWR